jgi:hypothetical protein
MDKSDCNCFCALPLAFHLLFYKEKTAATQAIALQNNNKIMPSVSGLPQDAALRFLWQGWRVKKAAQSFD